MITNVEQTSDIIFNGAVSVGDDVVLRRPAGAADSCLPESLEVQVVGISSQVRQEVEIDSDCGGRGDLILKDSYVALDFVGYSCDDDDVHNCFVYV